MLPTPLHIQLSSLDEGPDAYPDRALKPNPRLQQKSCRENQVFFAYIHRPLFPEHPHLHRVEWQPPLEEFTPARRPSEEITEERGQEYDGEEGLPESSVLQAQ